MRFHYRPLALALAAALPLAALASSHREAPFIAEHPKVDGTDFYMFRSYEPGRQGYVTLVANYLPLQDAYGGPNYFTLDPDAVYDINIDNDGDAREDLVFRFRFKNTIQDISLAVGPQGNTQTVPVPLITTVPGGVGPGALDRNGLNVIETYSVELIRGDRRNFGRPLTNMAGGADPNVFTKPVDNVGAKSIPDYAAYAGAHIYNVAIPGCQPGKLFVGQRKDPFSVNLGEVFDLVNTNAVGPPNGEHNIIDDKNVTSLILEVPVACLTSGSDPVVGGWTTASLPQVTILNPAPRFDNGRSNASLDGGALTQVSRLGSPLVNEVVIGIRDKDRFNASRPVQDPQFLKYVTNPALPELLEALFGSAGVRAPNNFPRNDLVAVFLTGIPGLTKPANLTAPGEMLRLNTGLAPTVRESQSNLGVLGGDVAGFPNGRRPGDDVVDIELRAAMGVLCTLNQPATFGCVPADAPTGGLPYTDGATVASTDFGNTFPYLNTPLAGSPSN
ncbi:MAG TPA: DUF4331 domain-containing protein [Gammaproteobacteria bacterium]|nr:DUF4331 domain-containing protein [Gammaproteobacteria bacterium]